MTAREQHRFAPAVLFGALVVLLLAVGWTAIDRRGARPEESADVAATATDAPATTAPGAARPGATQPGVTPSGATPAGTSPGARTTRPAPHQPAIAPDRLRTLPAATRQVVIVSTESYADTTATVEAFTKVGDRWQAAFAPMRGRIGSAGFVDRKVEGDLKTPTGVYAIGATMYGAAPDPGVRYGYHRLVPDDWWNENPASPGYNSFFHGPDPGGASEALWQITPQYDYFAVINYNIPVVAADPPRGSGIFLHVMVEGRATAGCIALNEQDLLAVLRWLDPGSAPRMVLAPRTVLSRF